LLLLSPFGVVGQQTLQDASRVWLGCDTALFDAVADQRDMGDRS
jgi:hypothetical protein